MLDFTRLPLRLRIEKVLLPFFRAWLSSASPPASFFFDLRPLAPKNEEKLNFSRASPLAIFLVFLRNDLDRCVPHFLACRLDFLSPWLLSLKIEAWRV